ncbi:MAG TPA: hypothetical protein VM935_01510 [Chitinophagaceae bacterium]|nr:hypothetical protein [Chitinophagaceae bacterium]
MKMLTSIGLVMIMFLINTGCEKGETAEDRTTLGQTKCLKGILVKKGICGQRVVKVLSQTKDGVSFAASWKDEVSGKSYENVYTVENSCSFPASIAEGDEFNFKLTADKKNDCVQCAAHTPVPKESNSIIVSTDCTDVEK